MARLIDQRTGLEIATKHSEDQRVFTMDFAALLDGGTVSSVTSFESTNQNLVSGSSNVTIASIISSGTQAQATISGGTNNEDYLIKVVIVDSASQTLVAEGLLQVRDA